MILAEDINIFFLELKNLAACHGYFVYFEDGLRHPLAHHEVTL